MVRATRRNRGGVLWFLGRLSDEERRRLAPMLVVEAARHGHGDLASLLRKKFGVRLEDVAALN